MAKPKGHNIWHIRTPTSTPIYPPTHTPSLPSIPQMPVLDPKRSAVKFQSSMPRTFSHILLHLATTACPSHTQNIKKSASFSSHTLYIARPTDVHVGYTRTNVGEQSPQRHQALCYSLFLQKQTWDISLLRIFHLSNIVIHPFQSVQCVCVCACVRACVRVCVCAYTLHIVMLEPLLLL